MTRVLTSADATIAKEINKAVDWFEAKTKIKDGKVYINDILVRISPIELSRFIGKYVHSIRREEGLIVYLQIYAKPESLGLNLTFEDNEKYLNFVFKHIKYNNKLKTIFNFLRYNIYIERKKFGEIDIRKTMNNTLPNYILKDKYISNYLSKNVNISGDLNIPIVKIHRDCVELENEHKYSARFLNNMVDVYLDFKDSKKILTEHMVGYTINDLKKFTNPARIKFSGKQVGLKTFHRLLELNNQELTTEVIRLLEYYELEFKTTEMALVNKWFEKANASTSYFHLLPEWAQETLVYFYHTKDLYNAKILYATELKSAEPYVISKLPLWLDERYNISSLNSDNLVKEGKHTFAQIKKAIKKGFNSEYIEDLKRGGIEELFEAPWFEKISNIKVPDTSEYYSIGHIKTYALAKYAGLKFGDVETTNIMLSFEETEKIKKWSKKTKKVYFAPLERNSRLTAVQIKRLLMPGVIKDKFGARKTLQFWAVIKSTIGGLLDDFDETMRSFVTTNSDSKERMLFNQYVVQECNIQHIDIRVEELHVYTMQHKDPKAINIGLYTNCCQYHGGVGHTCAMHSVSNPNGDVLVWRHNDRIIAQSWVWIHGEDTLVLDNVEFTNDVAHPKMVLKTMKAVLETLEYKNIFMGKQYNEMSPLIDVEIEAIPFSTPDGCYTDAEYGQWLKKDGEVLL